MTPDASQMSPHADQIFLDASQMPPHVSQMLSDPSQMPPDVSEMLADVSPFRLLCDASSMMRPPPTSSIPLS